MHKYLLKNIFFILLIVIGFVIITNNHDNQPKERKYLNIPDIMNKAEETANRKIILSKSMYKNNYIFNIKLGETHYIVKNRVIVKIDNNKTILWKNGNVKEFKLNNMDLIKDNDASNLLSDDYYKSITTQGIYFIITFEHKDREEKHIFKIHKYNHQLKQYQQYINNNKVIEERYYLSPAVVL